MADSSIPGNWKRTFFIIFSGQIFSLLTSAMVQFSIIWHLTASTGSPVVLSIASIMAFVPQAVIGPFMGVLIDRYNRKIIMILSDSFIALVSLALAAFFYFSDPTISVIYAVLILRSIASGFHMNSMAASVPMLAPKEELTRVSGWNHFVFSGANLAGPILGVSILAVWGIEYVLLVDVLGALIANTALLFVHIPQPEISEEELNSRGPIKEMKFGIKALTKSKSLLAFTWAMTIVTFVWMPVGSYFPLMVKSHFGGGAWHAGMVEVVFGVGMLAGSALLGYFGAVKKEGAMIATSLGIIGVLVGVAGLLPPDAFGWFLAICAAMGIAVPLFNGPYMAMLQTHVDPSVMGRVSSFTNSMMLIATPAGLLLAGPAAEATGLPMWFLLSGILLAILGFGCFLIKVEEGKIVD